MVTLDLALKEVANALWKKVLRGEMSASTALKVLEDLVEGRAIPVEPQDRCIVRAFEVAVKARITVYDALFMAFAAEKRLELATSDEVQRRAAEALGVRCVLV